MSSRAIVVQGCGNRLLLVDRRDDTRDIDEPALARRAQSEWRCDGVVVLEDADGAMGVRIVNADGSDGQLCVNGMRCAVLYEHVRTGQDQIQISAGGLVRLASALSVRSPADADDIGRRIIASRGVLVLVGVGRMGALDPVGGATRCWRVRLANPHVIGLFERADHATLERFCGQVEDADSVNAHVAAMGADGGVHLRSRERGVGFTRACASGAVAVAAALVYSELVPDAWVRVRMPGGRVKVRGPIQVGEFGLVGPAILGPAVEC